MNSVCNNVLFETYRSGSKVEPLPEGHDAPDERGASIEAMLMTADD